MTAYESPTITEIGSVADFTCGEGWRGDHDSITFFGRFTVQWGTQPTS